MSAQCSIIVLAAGQGSRFTGASHKLAQPFGESSVLGATLRHAIASQLHVVVVTTERFASEARQNIAARDVVVVPEVGDGAPAALGMGYSIASGVRASGTSAGWIVLPGDMPLLLPATLQAVARQLDRHPVAYAQYQGRRGHPVGFAAELYSELVALSGDEGARRLIARYPALGIELDDPGILADIDTAADLDSLREAALAAPARRAAAS